MKASTEIADGSGFQDTKQSSRGGEEVYRVWAVPLVDLAKDQGLEPDVGVVLLPAG